MELAERAELSLDSIKRLGGGERTLDTIYDEEWCNKVGINIGLLKDSLPDKTVLKLFIGRVAYV